MSQHHRSLSSSSTSSGLFHLFGVDTTLTKLFVGGLAWETNSDALRRHFEPFGEILEAVVICDKHSGRSKGYGFVTFRDPESARRACEDPTPIIDGRRANCNLASLGRPQPPPPTFAQIRSPAHVIGGVSNSRGIYVGSTGYQAVPFNYQQGYTYPPYGYTAFGPDYEYPQNVYSPQVGQQYIQIYGFPGPVNTTVYPFGQVGQLPLSGRGYNSAQGYAIPSHAYTQFNGPNASGINMGPLPSFQAPYPAAVPVPIPTSTPFLMSAHSAQFTQASTSDQTAVS